MTFQLSNPPEVAMRRVWEMPQAETFGIPAISRFLRKWIPSSGVIIDPFARNATWGNVTNDLNPATSAQHHMKAEDFVVHLAGKGVTAAAVLFDPPYSPRQISECYQAVGLECGMEDTQNTRLYATVRDGLAKLLVHEGIALSFGWNSVGFGVGRGFDLLEVLLVCHGGAHNDTICLAEIKR